MQKDEQQTHNELRKLLWIQAWTRTASASDCKEVATANKWADEALVAFDKRFPDPKSNENLP